MDETFDEVFDLDRCLRTGSHASQAAALKSLPERLSRIASSVSALTTVHLRLIDYFCSTTNDMRLQLVQAIRASQDYTQLIKATGGEMARRLGGIWDSNDVQGRVCVLYLVAALSPLLVDQPTVIYRIRQSMISECEDEYEAAVQTCLMFVQLDPTTVVTWADALLVIFHHRISVYSHLRPKILSLLSVETLCIRTETMIYASLAEKATDSDIDVLDVLTKVALRHEHLLRSHQELCQRFNLETGLAKISPLMVGTEVDIPW